MALPASEAQRRSHPWRNAAMPSWRDANPTRRRNPARNRHEKRITRHARPSAIESAAVTIDRTEMTIGGPVHQTVTRHSVSASSRDSSCAAPETKPTQANVTPDASRDGSSDRTTGPCRDGRRSRCCRTGPGLEHDNPLVTSYRRCLTMNSTDLRSRPPSQHLAT